ncbi:MAG: rod shape-determining protein [Clostridiales bacterium]|nr:rod shape-determining protein [Clostridiales bacterium]MCF8023650.1 rod shape-determining protein [Clostridiales bacterium]
MEKTYEQEYIFALDIGTRTVIGIVAEVHDDKIVVIGEELKEHSGRAMFDGQIHDIPRVASVVTEVKKRLEDKVGCNLEKVAVAAAGRSLYCNKVTVEQEVDVNAEITRTEVRSLELEALREAHRQLDESPDKINKYYCVGHTILSYSIDGYQISNLIGHRGHSIGCELIGTFLPVSVVNGLYAVLQRCDLEPLNLTLEPIAAIDVAIPENFRLLNLALVDMGAGTSDLAISKDGSIIAYGMVPVAGDEITEAVVESCLVDFDTAENIKKQVGKKEKISFVDITGVEDEKSYEEMMEIITPALDKLTREIANNLLSLNGGQPPRSVFCVGGGVLVPTFNEKLANYLEIKPERVILRDRSNLGNVIDFSQTKENNSLTGPEGITVAGIAMVAVKRLGFDFMSVVVNGKEYRLFNTRKIDVSDALGLIQFNPRNLIGKNGDNLHFYLNGEKKVVFGELSRPAEIQVNGINATLKSPVQDGDEIFIVKAENGKPGRAVVKDFIDKQEMRVMVNGKEEEFYPICLVNAEKTSLDTEIKTGDNVEIKFPPRAEDILNDRDGDSVKVNGKYVDHGYILQDNDQVKILTSNKPAEEAANIDEINCTPVKVNGKKILLDKQNPIFIDIFKKFDFDTENKSGVPVMKLNGSRAKYTDLLSPGDNIEIYWE